MRCLIVCTDELSDEKRNTELANVLNKADQTLEVYRRYFVTQDDKWIYSFWDFSAQSWNDCEDTEIPKIFDILFFHIGGGDPSGIPDDGVTFGQEFAFSTSSLVGQTAPGGRAKAIGMQPFPTGWCPVRKDDVAKLLANTKEASGEIPRFCRHPVPVSLLISIAILCQGYLAMHADVKGLPEGVTEQDREDVDSALKKMQWQAFCTSNAGTKPTCRGVSRWE